jgi:hypothetical protein
MAPRFARRQELAVCLCFNYHPSLELFIFGNL